MPSYSVRCNECGKYDTFVSKIADRDSTPMCCDKQTERLLDTPMVGAQTWTGWKGVHMPDGTWVESGSSYESYLKKQNKIPESEGIREAEIQSANRKVADEKKLNAAVEQAVRQHNK